MTDDEDDSADESFPNTTNLINEHYNYMAARENLQEFAGRVPQRKRKRESENSQQDSNKPKVRNIFCSSIPSSNKKHRKWKGTKEKEKTTFTFSPQTLTCLVIYFVIIIIGIEKT